MPDQAVGIAIRIGDGDKLRREIAVGRLDRKILLVVPHHRGQDFFGQVEKLRIEGAGDRRGPLGQVDQRVEQIVIAFVLCRDGANTLAALVGGKNDEVLAQLLFVVLVRDRKARRAQLAMAARFVARGMPAISNGIT